MCSFYTLKFSTSWHFPHHLQPTRYKIASWVCSTRLFQKHLYVRRVCGCLRVTVKDPVGPRTLFDFFPSSFSFSFSLCLSLCTLSFAACGLFACLTFFPPACVWTVVINTKVLCFLECAFTVNIQQKPTLFKFYWDIHSSKTSAFLVYFGILFCRTSMSSHK